MIFRFSVIFLFLLLNFSCSENDNKIVEIDFSDTLSTQSPNYKEPAKKIYVAIASITSPKETYTYYSSLLKYISAKLNRPIVIKQKKTYAEVNEMLENSEVDFAFICSGAYVTEYQRGKIKNLVVPVVENKKTYQAYIIANKFLNINSFNDFKGRSFAFSDPLSTTGRYFILKKLIENK